jgi:hypothetical protein
MDINIIPWTPPHTGAPGRPSDQVLYNAWTSFGASPDPLASSRVPVRPAECQNAARKQAMNEMCHADIHSAWSAADIKIQNLHKYLNRRVLPTDFQLPSSFTEQQDAAHVKETYVSLKESIDLNKPLHHLALLLAIIFSRLCPNVFVDLPENVSLAISNSNDSAHAYYKGFC